MNNLHRELAPISDAAWAQIEEETTRTLKRYLAGRRVVDVQAQGGTGLSAVGTGHLQKIAAPREGIVARQREVKALVELRVPFELERQAIDDVDRGGGRPRLRLATSQGRRALNRVCRGCIGVRGLRRRWHRGHSQGDQQSNTDAACRCARVSGGDCPGLEPAPAGRRQWSILGAARCRSLHCTRGDKRSRLPGAGAR
jgi:hypothetical protein